ncbi:CDP-diacylglycerol--glycerol-3-phosphate 3-phosphatidyltransferase [Chachezhania antarctica]|uniref:CDP-diacylglycerol--glycerol-3-phosphate 3-phosphatidyltransferase n=1 Tax=Chachezhania antarctica TaxID=2340860 RepID=UPI000EADA010|nr:CDP-diacylglycerol--glycerol-3-phosphate 3-phosphatidyltransferase [Chachezhania antarctica]|tara:strand:+ start:108 stop:767 length:660 start_codon:yes stop_codon:yes gene_type:complete
MTFPTVLTIARLLAAPLLALGFLVLARPLADWLALVLFVAASLTDWTDGYLARAWGQVTRLGTMLDPIADKAMVTAALLTLVYVSGLRGAILLPAVIILFREVFVSGLREFLGDVSGTLKVTKLAKWKTAAQMVAIAVLLAQGIAEHAVGAAVVGMDSQTVGDVLAGRAEDLQGLGWKWSVSEGLAWTGLGLIWLAAALTLVTGVDYFRKAWPHLKETE